jgi:hypothetical protein
MTPPQVKRRHVESVPIAQLIQHPRNPRRGRTSMIQDSIREVGFVDTPVVQESTGYVLGGNHRLRAAEAEGITEVPVDYIDVDDEQAYKILLVLNRTGDVAGYDDRELADALQFLTDSGVSLQGTGYTSGDLDDILARLNPPSLDDLAGAHGDAPAPGDGAVSFVWAVRVPLVVVDELKAAFAKIGGDSDHERALRLLAALTPDPPE